MGPTPRRLSALSPSAAKLRAPSRVARKSRLSQWRCSGSVLMGKLGQSAFLGALAAGAECRALTPLAQGKMPSILRRRSWALPEVPLRRRLFLLAAAGLLPLALM